MDLATTTPKRLYQEIGQRMRERITAGEFKVGERLPPEREIAEQMQVSRSVIREALIMLELEELVEVKKGSGVYVINVPGHVPSKMLAAAPVQPTDVGPFEMLQARQLLESNIAEFAATQVTKSDIDKMREALELERQAIETGSTDDYDGDEMFHMLIAEATNNSLLAEMLRELWARRQHSQMWQKLHARIVNQDYRHEWLEDHGRILAALQRKDPRAAKQAMWQHLENVKQRLLELSDIDDPGFDGYLFSSNPVITIAAK